MIAAALCRSAFRSSPARRGGDLFPCSFAATLPGFRAPVRGVPSVPSSQPAVLLLVCSNSGVRLWVKCSGCLHRPVCGDGALQSDSRDPGWFLRKPVPSGSSHPFHPNVNDAGGHQPVQTVGGTRKEEGEEEENGSVIYTDVYLLLEAAHRRLQAEAPSVSRELQLVGREVPEPVSLISQEEPDFPRHGKAAPLEWVRR